MKSQGKVSEKMNGGIIKWRITKSGTYGSGLAHPESEKLTLKLYFVRLSIHCAIRVDHAVFVNLFNPIVGFNSVQDR